MTIRDATLEDLPTITDIYNEAIANTSATFDTEPKTLAQQRDWFAHHDAQHPVLVTVENDRVVGWSSLSAWSDRCAYADTAEISTYIHVNCRGRGLGRTLALATIERGRQIGLHTIVGRVAEDNTRSLRAVEALGFRHIGVMEEVGMKFGRRLDVHLFQIVFPESP